MKTKKLLTLSASLAATTSASAEIHHTLLPEPMTASAGTEQAGINFHLSEGFAEYTDRGATDAGEFRLSFAENSSFKPELSSNNSQNSAVTVDIGSVNTAQRLSFNDLISGSSDYNQTTNYLHYINHPDSPWEPDSRGYVGLRFHENETPYYGWADVAYTQSRELVLYSFAYDDSGSAIRAGTVIPEPKTTALLTALLAGSTLAYRRRRSS